MSKQRYIHVDALRGVAVLLVVWMHVSEVFVHLSDAVRLKGTFLYDGAWCIDIGRIGVITFFMISGFVIAKSLSGSKLPGIRQFWIRRVLRLYPAYWLSLPFGLFAVWWLDGRPWSTGVVLANTTMIPIMLGSTPIMGHYWILETQLVFYVLCCLLFCTGLLRRPLALLVLSSAFVVVFGIIQVGNLVNDSVRASLKFMPYHLGIMLWAIVYRMWYDDRDHRTAVLKYNVPTKYLFILNGIVVAGPAMAAVAKGIALSDADLLRIGTSYLLGMTMFVVGSTWLQIKWRPIVWLGTISYSVYLLHPVAFYTLLWWLRNYAPQWLSEMHLGVYIVVCMILAIPLAAASYYAVERPLYALARRKTSANQDAR